eukprot:TRINITY_DN18874_c1_g1_i1.p1 TRINITY_DN18874_c1_g1~~TRINITY_DN18874_c1_g1_i1.p1  ORF type:complete len:366 (+),score=46.78 TRINITY_DN18874_c1_g1_i1:120-1100(+)
MFNARSETIGEKPVFSRLISRNRCLVVVNGFYEWKAEAKGKQPYFIFLNQQKKSQDSEVLQQERVMYMAGLFDKWCGPDEQILYSFTILTADSSKRIEWLHNRMPVILRNQEQQQMWLRNNQDGNCNLQKLFISYNEEDMNWYPVTKSMGNSKYQSQDCADDVRSKGIGKFLVAQKNKLPTNKRKVSTEENQKSNDGDFLTDHNCEIENKKQKTQKIDEEQQITSNQQISGENYDDEKMVVQIKNQEQKQDSQQLEGTEYQINQKLNDQINDQDFIDQQQSNVETKSLLSQERIKYSQYSKKKVTKAEKNQESSQKNTLLKYFKKK